MTPIRARLRAARKGKPPTPKPVSRAALQLALAHHIERQIDAGVIPDCAAAARALGLTRARLSQVASLLLLSPEIQERIAEGGIAASERNLRRFVAEPEWSTQLGLVLKEAST